MYDLSNVKSNFACWWNGNWNLRQLAIYCSSKNFFICFFNFVSIYHRNVIFLQLINHMFWQNCLYYKFLRSKKETDVNFILLLSASKRFLIIYLRYSNISPLRNFSTKQPDWFLMWKHTSSKHIYQGIRSKIQNTKLSHRSSRFIYSIFFESYEAIKHF